MHRIAPRVDLPVLAAGTLVLLLVGAAYAPGLSGGFLFDDFANLDTLGAYGPVDDVRTLLLYLTSGIADPTGRPVSVASFLIDARNWPADPWPFKRTNLVLHLLNGALLAMVVWRLEGRLAESGRGMDGRLQGWTALLAATLWLAHPLFVSTTLYVVQRHAMLPLTFVLLAMLALNRAHARLASGRTRSAWCWYVLGVGGACGLAGLSKANGLLAPLLLLIAFGVFYRPLCAALRADLRTHASWTAGLLLAAPALLVLVALWLKAPASLDFSGTRDFTLGERLLTQPRALWDYLAQLHLPRAGSGGVYVEGFPKSTGLLQPWTTLPALAGIVALFVFGLLSVRRRPVIAFALLFYLAGHLMESSVIMLELYFEHRNYLPAAFLFWPLARWLVAGRAIPVLRRAAAVLLVAILLLVTWQRAVIWGDPALLAAISLRSNPDSLRAHTVAADHLAAIGRPEAAADQLLGALDKHDVSTALAFNLVGVECRGGGVSSRTMALVEAAVAAERRWKRSVIGWMRNAIETSATGHCAGLGLAETARLLDVAERNPHVGAHATRRQGVLHLRGVHALASGQPVEALAWFERAVAARPDPDSVLFQAAMLGNAGQFRLGVEHIDSYLARPPRPATRARDMQSFHQRLLETSGYYDDELRHLRRALVEAEQEAAP